MNITLKKDEDKIKTILDYYILTNKLKDVVRSGWKSWGVKRERVESIAEHIYGTCMLAVAIWSETLPEVNLNHVIMMLALHETEEIIIGDITPFDNESKQKIKKEGQKAVQAIFKDLLIGNDVYFKIVEEFDAKETPEAIFAHKCDKLESDLQARIYSDEGSLVYSNAGEFKNNKNIEKLHKVCGDDVAVMFAEFDKKYFEENDDIFLKINRYLAKNMILKPKKVKK